jgi:hypothetical protein
MELLNQGLAQQRLILPGESNRAPAAREALGRANECLHIFITLRDSVPEEANPVA